MRSCSRSSFAVIFHHEKSDGWCGGYPFSRVVIRRREEPRRAGFGGHEEEGRVDAGHYKALQRVLLTFRVQSAPCSKIKHEMTRQRFARLFFSPSLSNPSASIPRIHPRSLVLLLARDCVCRHTVYRSNVTFFSPLLVLAPRAPIALYVAVFTIQSLTGKVR